MVCPLKLTLRVLFLSYFALNAYNHLQNVDEIHPTFAQKYTMLHGQLDKRVNFDLPEQLSVENVTKNSRTLAHGMLCTQLFLVAVAALMMPKMTVLVALNHLIAKLLQHDMSTLSNPETVFGCECLFKALALFAASMAVACCTGNKKKCA